MSSKCYNVAFRLGAVVAAEQKSTKVAAREFEMDV